MTLRHKVHTVKKVQHTHAHAHSRYTQGTTHALIQVNTYFHTHTYAPYNNDTSVLHREKKKKEEKLTFMMTFSAWSREHLEKVNCTMRWGSQ